MKFWAFFREECNQITFDVCLLSNWNLVFTINVIIIVVFYQDSSGLPQKLISFQLNTGTMGSLYIRKMSPNDQVDQIASKKRPFQDEEISVESKKTKKGQMIEVDGANRCDSHLKEIERLKQELRVRDEEVSNLNKIVVALTRKQGL